MTKIMISLIILWFSLPSWGEESSYLEGISILGEKRIAYISLPGGKISVTEGDEITINEGKAKGTWQVVLIKQDSVLFKTHEGSSAELRLDHRLPLPVVNESATVNQDIDNELATTNQAKLSVDKAGEDTDEEIPSLPPEDLPPFTPKATVVDEEEPSTPTPSPAELATTAANTSPQQPIEQEEIPPDHQLVKTPFGTFMIKK